MQKPRLRERPVRGLIGRDFLEDLGIRTAVSEHIDKIDNDRGQAVPGVRQNVLFDASAELRVEDLDIF